MEKLIIPPFLAASIPVTDIKHVVREINKMRKAQTWIAEERRRQSVYQNEIRNRNKNTKGTVPSVLGNS